MTEDITRAEHAQARENAPTKSTTTLPATQPVWLLATVAILTELGGAISLLALDHTVAGVLVAVGALLTGVGGKLAQSVVTPLARPQDDTGRPLVPAPIAGDPWAEPDPAGEQGYSIAEVLLVVFLGLLCLIALLALLGRL